MAELVLMHMMTTFVNALKAGKVKIVTMISMNVLDLLELTLDAKMVQLVEMNLALISACVLQTILESIVLKLMMIAALQQMKRFVVTENVLM